MLFNVWHEKIALELVGAGWRLINRDEHASISCSQIIMGILSDAGWLEEDVPVLHGLTLRLLLLESLPAFMILSVRF